MTHIGLILPEWWLKNMLKVQIKVMNRFPERPLPKYAHGPDEDAGMDLMSVEKICLGPNEIRAIDTGINVEIPASIMGEVRSRSGLALKGIVVNNAPGTIDPSYRGPVKVILRNQTMKNFEINEGDRIAQLVFVPYVQASWFPVDDLSESARGERGFGSTGLGTVQNA